MTKTEAVQKVVSLALDQVGTREGSNNWNKYANDPIITKYYGWSIQNQPWCDIFVDWCFLTAFGLGIGSKMLYGASAACGVSAQYYKDNGAFYKVPQLGDQSFYFASGGINHTGLVVAIDDTYYTAVEGNYSDQVSKVKHRLNGSDTAGFGRPNWQIITDSDNQTAENAENVQRPGFDCQKEDHEWKPTLLKYGSVGEEVMLLQSLLKCHKFQCGKTDGEFGPATQAAVYSAQEFYGLSVDGKVWKETLTALGLDKSLFGG